MELTNRLKRRFIKDCGLSIAITDSPYFEYFIELYDTAFNTKHKLNTFMDIVNNFNTEEEVLDYLQNITDSIVNNIKSKAAYQTFVDADMNQFAIKSKYPSSSIFKVCHTGKELISIDLSKANFQAMNYFNPNILEASSYEDFLRKQGITSEYILKSKYIRQVIFGNLISKRISVIEKHIIYKIVEELEKFNYTILLVTEDEIVLEGNLDIYNNILNIIKTMNIQVAVELFVLNTLRRPNGQPFKSDKFYVKEFITSTDAKLLPFEIKATDSTFYPQFFKLIQGMEITDNDLAFINEGFIAQYKNKIDGEIY